MDTKITAIKQRILQIAKNKRIKIEDFCEKNEISYSNFKGDRLFRPINSDSLVTILTTNPDINPEWLLTGKGEMIKNLSENFTVQEPPTNYVIKKKIPLVKIEVAAGFGSSDFAITEQDIESSYVVPDFNGIDFMIRVKGSSMYPKYSSGDIIACRKLHSSTFIQWNKCHVVATSEQGLLVKRLKKGSTERCVLAISDNKEYDPFEIPLDEITGIALVIGVIRLE